MFKLKVGRQSKVNKGEISFIVLFKKQTYLHKKTHFTKVVIVMCVLSLTRMKY